MTKVLILANSSSGLYDFRNELIVELLGSGHEVFISLPDDVKASELAEEGCRIIHTDINRRGVNPVQDLGLFRSYMKLIRSERPELVLTYTIKPNIYGGMACRLLKVPQIGTVTGLGTTFERGGMLLKLIVMMYKTSLKKCRCLFFQNEENRDKFASHGIRALKTATVHGSGVNLDKHRAEAYPGHEDDITRFLYVGRIMKEKGIDEYLHAARKLHDEYGDRVSFAAVGYYDDDYESVIRQAEDDGVIKRIPFQKDIHPYMREADAIVHPSYHEGMSNVIMEAAACARPVIASDISGCREMIDADKSGYLIKPRDKDSLTQALERFMELSVDERRAMGEAGRLFVEAHFDRRDVVSSYMSEIEDIKNGR